MRFCRFGRGERDLVILPGLSVQSVMAAAPAIAAAYAPLTKDFTVTVFDRREDLPPRYAIREMAEDTAAAMTSSGLKTVSLFGASQGGMIAMELAGLFPDRVEKLALGSTAARVPDGAFSTVETWIRLARARDAAGLYAAFGEAVYPPAVWKAVGKGLIRSAESVTEEELDRFVILAEGTRGFDGTAALEKIACPVLAIGDRTDRIFGAEGTLAIGEILRDKAGAETWLYDGYGHAAYDVAPDYKERLLRFLLS
ncbi:MAG: alpha/beta hydrolase [Clostridia bacterium]|nr:alpha/beta hydrolase [Clostridia bacterium]